MNRDWHERNPMPAKPTVEQRLDWHLAHAAACDCRKVTPGLVQRMRDQAARLPADRASALAERLDRLKQAARAVR